MIYADRREAGRALAQELTAYRGDHDAIVLALPRGGVPVAYEIARALHLPLDLMIVRKLGYPGQEELAIGAIASGGAVVYNEELLHTTPLPRATIDAIIEREQAELARREAAYRGDRPPIDLRHATVILVDDGLATGSTMLAAVQAVHRQRPKRVIVAVPVAPPETIDVFRSVVDDIVCPATPARFGGVGKWYHDFTQTTDQEVRHLLQLAEAAHQPLHTPPPKQG